MVRSVENLSCKSLVLLLVFPLLGVLGTGCGSPEMEEPERPGWSVIGPGGGGSTFIPTFSPHSEDTMLVRCDMTGGYLSQNGGASWKMLNFVGGSQNFAFDPSDSERMYVGATGLHRTTDGGDTWELIFPDPASIEELRQIGDHASNYYVSSDNYPSGPGASVRSVVVDPTNSKHIFAAIGGRSEAGRIWSVYFSEDDGTSWKVAAEFSSPIVKLVSPLVEDERVFVVCSDSYSILSRETHEVIQASREMPEEMTPLSQIDFGQDPESKELRFWGVSAAPRGGASKGVFLSEDDLESWREVSPPLPEIELEGEFRGISSVAFQYVATSQADSRVAYLICDRFLERRPNGEIGLWYGILKTTDSGANWDWVYKAGGGSPDYTVRDGAKAENVRDSWVEEAFAGEYIRMINVGVSPTNPELAAATDWYRTLKTTDGGKTWDAVYSETLADGSIRSRGLDVTTTYGVHFDPFDPDHLVISYTDIAYFHSFDRGKTWRRSVEGVPPRWDNTCYWVQFDPEVKDKLWSVWGSMHDIPKLKMIRSPGWEKRAVGGVCLSMDGGRSWEVSSDGLPENSPTTSLLLEPESEAGERVLYASVYGKGVYKSVDDGRSWEQRNQGLGQNLNAWEIVRSTDGILYLVVTFNTQFEADQILPDLLNGEVYRSADQAESWQRVELPPTVRFPNSVAVDPGNPDLLFVACWATLTQSDFGRFEGPPKLLETDGGVIRSEDGGETWKSVFDKSAYVYAVTVDPRHPGSVYLNTFHHEAYRSDNWGESWGRIKDYKFQWGHRVIVDKNDAEMIYITTFGGSVFHGYPTVE